MSLQETYDELKVAGSVSVDDSESALKSLYVMLFRKHKAYCQQMDEIGFLGDNLRDTTISVKYDFPGGRAVYKLAKKRQPKQYNIIRQELPDEPQVTCLRADLDSDQSSAVWDGSTDPSAQDNAADSDPLREEGEDDGSSTHARHWRTH